ncbi:NAD(P)/FAD-dependent oxidoreductase [Planctomonas sp. JC2975]|uniref:FAD-dependent oxidoreductase n=1 Tax=Planctomonas sp. JC2975 TaxID=2729626 RepID=UPI0014756740|nr:FAD-dependent oxidoreductase [Planctomonas sp. JC2975]NNC10970.1 NAD(P)/FAD-dependent oxidoreductase [Planctomonas sp. JC2975]
MHVLIVGAGPVGARLAEGLLPAVRSGVVEVTLVGAEPVPAYNRVLVAEHAVGGMSLDEMLVHDVDELADAGAGVRLGTRVVCVDRDRRAATLDDGSVVAYDRIVFATGARANIPTLDGVPRTARDAASLRRTDAAATGLDDRLPRGVTVLRDLEDAARVAAAVQARQRVVVLGAGVLGLELALLLAGAGCEVVVVHHGPTPMPRNLDRGAGLTLASSLRNAGVGVVAHSRAEAVAMRRDPDTGEPHFDALVTADGKHVHGALLVLSCGVGARSELATAADLPVEAGILVDRTMTSWTDPSVHAIGDCAHVADPPVDARTWLEAGGRAGGGPSGLIGPGWQQADWLAARLTAEASGIPFALEPPDERAAIVMLKGESVDCVAVGDVTPEPWDLLDDGRRVAQWADPEHGGYVKTVTRAGVLTGFAAVGMPRTAAELTLLFERGAELPADRSLVLRFDGVDHDPAAESSAITPDTTICWCNGVSAGRIGEAISCGAATVAEVGGATRAGTGCGGCRERIQGILDDRSRAVVEV